MGIKNLMGNDRHYTFSYSVMFAPTHGSMGCSHSMIKYSNLQKLGHSCSLQYFSHGQFLFRNPQQTGKIFLELNCSLMFFLPNFSFTLSFIKYQDYVIIQALLAHPCSFALFLLQVFSPVNLLQVSHLDICFSEDMN